MATTTKEPASPTSAVQEGLPASQGTASQPSPRTDAIGIEIPVSLYASRYSAAGRGVGKALPPVREETRTVIVFAQGAVVRLSASLSVGETVVLTNLQTGADVLCRVSSVKTQPGIQNYVDLEFTQRAPGFWEQRPGKDGRAPAARPAPEPVTKSAPFAPAPPVGPVPSVVQAPPVASVVESPPVSPAPQPRQPQAPAKPLAPSERLSPTILAAPAELPAPAADVPAAPAFSAPAITAPAVSTAATEVPPVPAVSTPRPTAPAVSAQANAEPERTPSRPTKALPLSSSPVVSGVSAGLRMEQSGQTMLGNDRLDWTRSRSSGSKKTFWATVAVLAVAGLAGGGYMLSQRGQSSSAEPQITVAPPSAPALETSAPALGASDEAASPAAADAATDAPAAAPGPTVETPAPATAPAQPPVRRPAIPLGSLRTPVPKEAAISGSSEPPPALSARNSAAEEVLGSGVLSGASRVEAPPPPGPTTSVHPGGQLTQPKVISSPDPQYPAAARARSVQGVVVLDALVDATGHVSDIKAVSGPILLQQAAIDALSKWKYEPARLNGQPTSVHINVSIAFSAR